MKTKHVDEAELIASYWDMRETAEPFWRTLVQPEPETPIVTPNPPKKPRLSLPPQKRTTC